MKTSPCKCGEEYIPVTSWIEYVTAPAYLKITVSVTQKEVFVVNFQSIYKFKCTLFDSMYKENMKHVINRRVYVNFFNVQIFLKTRQM